MKLRCREQSINKTTTFSQRGCLIARTQEKDFRCTDLVVMAEVNPVPEGSRERVDQWNSARFVAGNGPCRPGLLLYGWGEQDLAIDCSGFEGRKQLCLLLTPLLFSLFFFFSRMNHFKYRGATFLKTRLYARERSGYI